MSAPRRLRRSGRAALALALVAVGVAADLPGPAGDPRPAQAFPGLTVDLVGHGFGHGRGMGQYGALGYAVNHQWAHGRILDHYYGNTERHVLPAAQRTMRVHITRFDRFDTGGIDTIAGSDQGGVSVPSLAPGQTFGAVRVKRTGANRFDVEVADNCAGAPTGWKPLPTGIGKPGPINIEPPRLGGDHRADMLQLCDPSGTRWVRGRIIALEGTVGGRTGGRVVNELDIDAYLKGVVPRESPASWGAMGGGLGLNALKAQAVAARSYALAEKRSEWAQTCDTQQCQVYLGHAEDTGAGFKLLEAESTNQAVTETAGEVRMHTAAAGAALVGKIARTEFSSSTGGWSAGGVFPPVVDEGDAVDVNPSREWTAKVPVDLLQAARPEIGTLLAVDVIRRNGFGAMGGRVLELELRGTQGKARLSGGELRLLYSYSSAQRPLGIRSDWFRVVNNPSGGLSGYWVAAPDGGIFSFGDAKFHGSTGGMTLNHPVIDLAGTPSGDGYWLAARDGGIFTFGDAGYHGSTGHMVLNQPVVGMAPTESGDGYWMVASDGGIFTFGNAGYFGSRGGQPLNKPVVGMAPTPSGDGYWLVASDGGIFTFGDARFHGSTGGRRLNSPIVGMAPSKTGDGYWLLGADGGLFAFGDAGYHGSLPQAKVPGPAEAMRATRTGDGYLIATGAGEVVSFGDAPALGSVDDVIPNYRGGVVALEVKAAPKGS